MTYILEHRPDEFGLVPDMDGFVTDKEFLWAIHEEEGWGYVRQGHINEVFQGKDRSLFLHDDKRIKALNHHWNLDTETPSLSLPKLLFLAVKRNAHPIVMEKGLLSNPGGFHILSPERAMAMRIGQRRDQKPVLLEIMAARAGSDGIPFFPFGALFLTSEIPIEYISGPPVPKDIPKPLPKKSPKEPEPLPDFQTGTFILDANRDMDPSRRPKGKKGKGWKEEARKERRRRNR